MGKLLCEKILRDVWCRNEIVRAEIGQIVHTHTHTRVSYSSIDCPSILLSSVLQPLDFVNIMCGRMTPYRYCVVNIRLDNARINMHKQMHRYCKILDAHAD